MEVCFTEGECHNGTMMNDDLKPSGKIRKCRISRNKKRYWKKGTQIQDAEDFLCEVQVDAVKSTSKISSNFGWHKIFLGLN